MSPRRLIATFLHAVTLLFGMQGTAFAHLMPLGNGAVRLVGDSAYAVIAVPVSELSGFDDNRDGLIEAGEINAHRAALESQVTQRLHLDDGERPGRLIFSDLLISHTDEAVRTSDNMVVMRRYQWDQPLQSLRLRANFFTSSSTANRQLTVRVLKDGDTEAAILSEHRAEYRFFAGAWTTLFAYIATGAEHILLGADHLLFLLTVLIVGAGWRYWLVVITSFTVAHSITLTLAALDVVKIPATIIEPMIAASIVLLAVDNLWRRERAVRHRLGLVFACGLLHGLGIASALTEIGLSGRNRVASLLGFNVGVELGQMVFVAGMLLFLQFARRLVRQPAQERMVQAFSVVAAIAGAGWMVERLL
jgi:hydrogenase/urease accessory protein HupE